MYIYIYMCVCIYIYKYIHTLLLEMLAMHSRNVAAIEVRLHPTPYPTPSTLGVDVYTLNANPQISRYPQS